MELPGFLRKTPSCIRPWTSFEVDDGADIGPVRPCCWLLQYIGDLRHDTLERIWNGPQAQHIRHAMLTGQSRDYCPEFCPILQCPEEDKAMYWKRVERSGHPNALLNREELLEGRVTLRSRPVTLKVTPSLACNLNCIMCYQPHSAKIHLSRGKLAEIEAWLSTTEVIHLQGGEVFVSREGLWLLERTLEFPDLRVGVITNGIFPQPIAWSLLEKVRFEWLIVSLDAATGATYQKIRVGGNWDKAITNLHNLCMLRSRRGNDFRLYLDMTVMHNNCHEIPLFVELAHSFELDASFHLLTPEERTMHLDAFNNPNRRDVVIKVLAQGLDLAKSRRMSMAEHTLQQLLIYAQSGA